MKSFDEMAQFGMPLVLAEVDTVARSVGERSSLVEMTRYHFSTGGKRLRAMIPLWVAEALGTDPRKIVPFGAACEMLHNATLVHDDLQDGDTHRRGHETIWKRYGAPQAINLGDAMFYFTLLLVRRMDLPSDERENLSERILRETLRVIDGQEQEFLLKNSPSPTLEDYLRMVEGKTSGLFALPLCGAAMACGQPVAAVETLSRLATDLGVLFQIQDDLIDLYGDKGRVEVGSDIAEGKYSAPVVLALETLAQTQSKKRDVLRKILAKFRKDTVPEDILRAKQILEGCGAIAGALALLREREQRVRQGVKGLPLPLGTVVVALLDEMITPLERMASPLTRAACGGEP